METVLDLLALRHTQEQDVRADAVLRRTLRRLEGHLVDFLKSPPPAQGLLPERRVPPWVPGVHTDALPVQAHVTRVNQRCRRASSEFRASQLKWRSRRRGRARPAGGGSQREKHNCVRTIGQTRGTGTQAGRQAASRRSEPRSCSTWVWTSPDNRRLGQGRSSRSARATTAGHGSIGEAHGEPADLLCRGSAPAL